jgi:hypothetical protein
LSSTSFSSSRSTHFRLPPPRLRPSHHMPGLPCKFFLAGRGRGVQRVSGGPPFLESPGDERRGVRRRGGGPLISKDQHQEINTRRSTCNRNVRLHTRRRPARACRFSACRCTALGLRCARTAGVSWRQPGVCCTVCAER